MKSILFTLILQLVSGDLPTPESCHFSFKQSNVNLHDYYPSMVGSKKLPLLRYSGAWNGEEASDTCAIVLDNCETCGCSKHAMLIQALNWTVSCLDLPASVIMVEQRSIDTEDSSDAGDSVADDNHLLGDAPPSNYSGIISNLQQQAEVGDSNAQALVTSSVDLDLLKQLAEYTESIRALQEVVDSPSGRMAKTLGAESADAKDESIETTTLKAQNEETTIPESIEEASTTPKEEKTTTREVKEEVHTTTEGNKEESTTTKEQSTTSKKPIKEAESTTLKAKVQMDQDEEEEGEAQYLNLKTQLNSWKSRYFVVLGFFIVFTLIFIAIIAVLFVKLQNAKRASNTGNVSPGPGLGDTEPLTPKDHATFKFDDGYQK